MAKKQKKCPAKLPGGSICGATPGWRFQATGYCGKHQNQKHEAKITKHDLIVNEDTYLVEGTPVAYTSLPDPTCGANVSGRPCEKRGAHDGRCKKHVGKPRRMVTTSEIPERFTGHYDNTEFGIDSPGFHSPCVVKYEYDSYADSAGDYDGYGRNSIIMNRKVGGYSPTAHAAAINVRGVKDEESFNMAMHVYAAKNFTADDWEIEAEDGYYGQEAYVETPKEDPLTVFNLSQDTTEERLGWIGEQLGIDMEGAEPQEFDISDFVGLISPIQEKERMKQTKKYSYRTGEWEGDAQDVDLSVPLAIAERVGGGLKVLWGQETLSQMVSIADRRKDDNGKFMMFVINR